MKIRRLIAENDREVVAITDGSAEVFIPTTEVPREALELFLHRLRDRIARPVAWKRRNAREERRHSTKRLHGRERVERHIPVRAPRYRRRGSRGFFRRRWGIPAWTRHMT